MELRRKRHAAHFRECYLRNNLRYANSQERQTVIGYEQTIHQAFGDVSDALIAYEKYHRVRERQEQTVRILRRQSIFR